MWYIHLYTHGCAYEYDIHICIHINTRTWIIHQVSCNAAQRSATRCNAVQRGATQCNAVQRSTTHCNSLQNTATRCNTLHHTASHCITLHHTATHCNTPQHTATHCNTLQHTQSCVPHYFRHTNKRRWKTYVYKHMYTIFISSHIWHTPMTHEQLMRPALFQTHKFE